MGKKYLPSIFQEFIHVSRYARWDEEKGRRETWDETVKRYFDFFENHLKINNGYDLPHLLREELENSVLNLAVMPSMRALMTAGPALERDNMAGYNCLGGDTLVTTLEYGVIPIKELQGKEVHVVDGNGEWTLSKCNHYGKQSLIRTYFGTSGNGDDFYVDSTPNHRWFLKDLKEIETGDLVEGQKLSSVKFPNRSEINSFSDDYKKGIQHGIIYGDGTAIQKKGSGKDLKKFVIQKICKGFVIRICSDIEEILPYFSAYPKSYPKSFNGDPVVYIFDSAIDLKELPNEMFFNNDYLTGFVRGWFAADGSISKSGQIRLSCNEDGLNWILKNGPRLGFITNNSYKSSQETNYGIRKEDLYNLFFDRRWIVKEDFIIGRKRERFTPIDLEKNSGFGLIKKIEHIDGKHDVFCFEVPTTNSFLLTKNLLTGNCSFIEVNRIRAFDEILHVLLNGCLHEDTLIKTKDGDKKICEITNEDKVLSFDIDKKQYEFINPQGVGPTPISFEKEKIEIEFEDGTKIKCTSDHEFFTTNRGWVRAEDLNEEDDVKNYHEID